MNSKNQEVIDFVNECFSRCASAPGTYFETPSSLSASLDLLLELYAKIGLRVEYGQEQYIRWRKQELPLCPECLPTTEWFMQRCFYLTGHEHMLEILKHWSAYKSYLESLVNNV